MDSLGKPHSSQPLHGVLGTKTSKYCPHPPGSGAGLWMTPLSSRRKSNKQDFLQHINSVDPAIKFTVEDNKEDGSIPLLDTIVKPEVMVVYPLLCTGNLPILASTYSGIATTTSLPSLVSSTPSPTGPNLCAAILSCSNKKRNTSGSSHPV